MHTLAERRLVIVGGKGGVGRTTIAAALATVLAREGQRVLLAHVRTKQRVHRMLGCHELDENIREVEPNLWAVNMNPRAALRERGLMVLRFKAVYRAVMENRLVKYFLRAIPALDEYSMLGKAWYHTTEVDGNRPKYDTVIFDGPATGHLVTMLRIPAVIVDVVPEGPLTRDARSALELLTDPARTVMWIVTLAEEMAVTEAADLYRAALNDLHVTPERVVINALYPDLLGSDPEQELSRGLDRLERSDAAGALAHLLGSVRTIRSRRHINDLQLGRLRRRVPLPTVEVPHLFTHEIDRPALDRIAAHLRAALAPPPLTPAERA